MLRAFILSLAPLSLVPLSLAIATPAAAVIVVVPFDDSTEHAGVTGPYARYSPHILKLSESDYTVVFKPGFVDAGSAIRAVVPLCAAKGKQAQGISATAPVELIIEGGETSVMQGYRVACK